MATAAKKSAAKPKAKPATAIIRGKNKSILFEGLVADAEQFLRDHFPRVHDVNEPDFTIETTPKSATVELPPGHPDPAAVAAADDEETE